MKTINTPSFNGYSVWSEKGPLIENILVGNEEVLAQAIRSHNRVAVMRFDLKFPAGYQGNTNIISKFFDSLRFRLKQDLVKKTESRGRAIGSAIGYTWVKELGGNNGWHYHVALFLNYDVYNCLGAVKSENDNMYNRVLKSWASALSIPLEEARKGLVNISPNPIYKLDAKSQNLDEEIHAVLNRLSYLAKVRTKPYGEGSKTRFYGTSKR